MLRKLKVEIEKPKPLKEIPEPVITNEQFHVIVGCFGKEKCQKNAKKLTRKGFSKTNRRA